MLSIWKKSCIKLGGKRQRVQPLTLEHALELALLLAPHIGHIQARWPDIRATFEVGDGDVLTALFTGLRDELATMPGDMLRAMALLTGLEVGWIAANVTAREFVDALPVLDRVNDFSGLWAAMQLLGLTVRGNGKSRAD